MGGWVGCLLLTEVLPVQGEEDLLGLVVQATAHHIQRPKPRPVVADLDARAVENALFVGRWVGGWVGWMEEKKAVGMSYCELWVGEVGKGNKAV